MYIYETIEWHCLKHSSLVLTCCWNRKTHITYCYCKHPRMGTCMYIITSNRACIVNRVCLEQNIDELILK